MVGLVRIENSEIYQAYFMKPEMFVFYSCLVSVCAEALEANEEAIGEDQIEYHSMLKNAFAAMMERLNSYFGDIVCFL